MIREAERSESGSVAALLARLYDEIGHVPPETVSLEDVTASLIANEPGYRALLALMEEKIEPVGVLTLSESSAPYAGGYFGIVQEFYVVPEMRSRGVGRAMMLYAREVARHRRWSRLEVTAPPDDNTRSIAFYRNVGFTDSGPRLYLPVPQYER